MTYDDISVKEATQHVREELNRPENADCQDEVRQWLRQDLLLNGCPEDVVNLVMEYTQ